MGFSAECVGATDLESIDQPKRAKRRLRKLMRGLLKDAQASIKLVGAKGVDSPRVKGNEEQEAQMEGSKKLTPGELTSSAAWF